MWENIPLFLEHLHPRIMLLGEEQFRDTAY